jgi:hypothetical protein
MSRDQNGVHLVNMDGIQMEKTKIPSCRIHVKKEPLQKDSLWVMVLLPFFVSASLGFFVRPSLALGTSLPCNSTSTTTNVPPVMPAMFVYHAPSPINPRVGSILRDRCQYRLYEEGHYIFLLNRVCHNHAGLLPFDPSSLHTVVQLPVSNPNHLRISFFFGLKYHYLIFSVLTISNPIE